jgi:hypothetical protein
VISSLPTVAIRDTFNKGPRIISGFPGISAPYRCARDLLAGLVVTARQCVSCHLPLPPGVVHGTSADCNIALEKEIAMLKSIVSLHDERDVEPAIPEPVAPSIRLRVAAR